MEYKKEAVTTFNYDSSLNMIIYDHLISETDEPNRKETMYRMAIMKDLHGRTVSGSTYPKFSTATLQEGQFPAEKKILNDAGAIDEELLKQQSDKK